MLDSLEFDAAMIKELSNRFNPEDVQLFYQIALIGKRDLYLSTTPQSALEMTLLRMLSFRPADDNQAAKNIDFSVSSGKSSSANGNSTSKIKKENLSQAKSKKKNNDSFNTLAENDDAWPLLVEKLGLQGVSYSLASNCSVESVNDELLTLHLAHQHEGIATQGAKQRLEKALREYFDGNFKLKFDISDDELETPARKKDRVREKILSQAEKNAEEDDAVKALKSQFGAEIIEGSVRPVDE